MFSKISKLILLLLLVSCGTWLDPWHKPKKRKGPSVDPISQRLAFYCNEMPDPVDKYDGDSLFFTGFARAACSNYDMSDFTNRPGRYQRWSEETGITWDQPADSDPSKTKARSENTRDGYLAVLWNAWAAKDLKTLEDIRDWGRRRNWFMGDGRLGGVDTIFTPTIRSTLAQMIYALGGEDDIIDRNLPAVWGKCEDYECWLLVTHIALRGEAFGQISGDALDALEHAVLHFPENPLYQWVYRKYVDGDSSDAIALLLGSPWHFPDRLAEADTDFCEQWPYRRNRQSSAMNRLCDREEPHSAGDWAFAAWLIQRG